MSLSVEQIAGLLASPKTAQGGGEYDQDAWQDELANTEINYNSFDGETYPCEGCGHCIQPGKCPQSVQCPVCGARTSTLCREGTRLVGFHEARWNAAGGTYKFKTDEEKLLALALAKLTGKRR